MKKIIFVSSILSYLISTHGMDKPIEKATEEMASIFTIEELRAKKTEHEGMAACYGMAIALKEQKTKRQPNNYYSYNGVISVSSDSQPAPSSAVCDGGPNGPIPENSSEGVCHRCSIQ